MVVFAAAIPALGVAGYGQTQPGAVREMESQERVTYFSGIVTLEDGTAPPDAVRLRRVCNGLFHDEGWADAKGRFWFKIGKDDRGSGSGDAAEAVSRPASTDKPLGFSYSNPITVALEGCEMEVVLAGYRADRVSLKVAGVGATNLGTMVLHPISKVSTLTVSATTLQAPPNARKAYDKGLEAIHARKWDAAGADFGKAVQAYPKFAAAWYELGEARLGHGDAAGAADAWRESAKADPGFVKPWERLTAFADLKQDWAESARSSDVWLRLDPDDFPGAWLYNAIARARLGRLDDAEHSAREGLRVDKDRRIPRLSYVLGLILLEKHRYAESAECFRDYLKLAPGARDADAVRQQLSDLEKLPATRQIHAP
jgi:tetratricopeptide (TPR) repeat protein